MLENPSVQIVLLAGGETFAGAITEVPPTRRPSSARSISPTRSRTRSASWSDVVAVAERAGARGIVYDPVENAHGFVIDAPTTPHAFGVVREVFGPLYGSNWWAEVSTFPHFN